MDPGERGYESKCPGSLFQTQFPCVVIGTKKIRSSDHDISDLGSPHAPCDLRAGREIRAETFGVNPNFAKVKLPHGPAHPFGDSQKPCGL